MDDEQQDVDSFKKPCSGSKRDLLHCLRKSDCVQKHGHTPLECMKPEMPGYDPDCRQLQVAFFECKRSLLDTRQRFRGRKGY